MISSKKGFGVRATEEFSIGNIVCCYYGEIRKIT